MAAPESKDPLSPSVALIGLTRAKFSQAARWDEHAQRLFNLTAILSACFILLPIAAKSVGGPLTQLAPLVDRIAGLLLALCTVCAFYAAQVSRNARLVAEQSRRATLLVNGLGYEMGRNEYLLLKRRAALPSADWESAADPDYFATRETPGYPRLAGMLAESVHYSHHLLDESARCTLRTVLLLGAAPLFILLFSLWLSALPQDLLLTEGRVLVTIALALISAEYLGKYFAYRNAADALSSLPHRLDEARNQSYPEPRMIAIMGDYNSAVESAPLFVRGLYGKLEPELKRTWDSAQSEATRPARNQDSSEA